MLVYISITKSMEKNPDASVFINIASVRSVHETTTESLKSLSAIKNHCGGVPEQQIKDISQRAEKNKSESLVLRR